MTWEIVKHTNIDERARTWKRTFPGKTGAVHRHPFRFVNVTVIPNDAAIKATLQAMPMQTHFLGRSVLSCVQP